jgi:hypothetical protein
LQLCRELLTKTCLPLIAVVLVPAVQKVVVVPAVQKVP